MATEAAPSSGYSAAALAAAACSSLALGALVGYRLGRAQTRGRSAAAPRWRRSGSDSDESTPGAPLRPGGGTFHALTAVAAGCLQSRGFGAGVLWQCAGLPASVPSLSFVPCGTVARFALFAAATLLPLTLLPLNPASSPLPPPPLPSRSPCSRHAAQRVPHRQRAGRRQRAVPRAAGARRHAHEPAGARSAGWFGWNIFFLLNGSTALVRANMPMSRQELAQQVGCDFLVHLFVFLKVKGSTSGLWCALTWP